jgi:hypothetical protein
MTLVNLRIPTSNPNIQLDIKIQPIIAAAVIRRLKVELDIKYT